MYPRPFGNYLLLERIGANGMSEVDLARKAEDQSFVRFLVIKRIRQSNSIDEHYIRMFQDEARINAELSHENIAQVYDFGRITGPAGDEFYMAMEYVPGLDLRAVQLSLAERGVLLPRREAMTVLCGVLRALQYAHSRVDQLGRPMNIIHRDVNPRNVMVSVNGEVKLIDFGVAKAADRLEKTEGNAVKGKFAYMSPEQIDGGQPIDGRADLYAVGLMLHELLTGRSPFVGLTEVQILHRVLSGNLPPLPDAVAAFKGIHARALATRAEDRYPSADAFRADLEQLLGTMGGVASHAEIAAMLRDAKGDQVGDMAKRLRGYRDSSSPSIRPPIPPPPQDNSGTFNVNAIREPGHGFAWVPWALGVGGGLVGVVAIVGVVGAGLWWSTREVEPVAVAIPVVTPVEAPALAVAPAITPEPARTAKRNTAGSATPAPPVRATPPPAATPIVPAPIEAAPVEPAAPIQVEPVAPVAAVGADGYLLITSRPAVGYDVFLGTKRIGATPIRRVKVPAGTYAVTVRNPANGDTRTVEVTIVSYQTSAAYVATFE